MAGLESRVVTRLFQWAPLMEAVMAMAAMVASAAARAARPVRVLLVVSLWKNARAHARSVRQEEVALGPPCSPSVRWPCGTSRHHRGRRRGLCWRVVGGCHPSLGTTSRTWRRVRLAWPCWSGATPCRTCGAWCPSVGGPVLACTLRSVGLGVPAWNSRGIGARCCSLDARASPALGLGMQSDGYTVVVLVSSAVTCGFGRLWNYRIPAVALGGTRSMT